MEYDMTKRNHNHFATLGEMVEFAKREPTCPTHLQGSRDRDGGTGLHSHSWTWGTDFDGAVKLAETGYPDGQKITLLAEKISAKLQSEVTVRDSMVYDTSGSYVDVGAFMSGEPECMVEFVQEEKPRSKVISIGVDMCYNGGIKAKTIELRGAVIVALIDALEQFEYRCEVTLYAGTGYSSKGGPKWQTSATIKRAGDTLDRDSMAYAISHPAFYRRIIFGAWDGSPWRVDMGYGYSACMTPLYKDDTDVKMDCPQSNDWTESNATQRIIDAAKECGVSFD